MGTKMQDLTMGDLLGMRRAFVASVWLNGKLLLQEEQT